MSHPFKTDFRPIKFDTERFHLERACHPKIKHSTSIGDYTNGGYKDVDIELKFESLKIIWIRRLLDSNFHSWKAIPQCLLSEIGIQSIFHSNFKPSEICQREDSFISKIFSRSYFLLGECWY